MALKEKLINLRIKLNHIKNEEVQEHTTETHYVNFVDEEELNEILINTTNNFFPKTGEWSSSCFRRPNEILQSNLRNNELLAKMILRKTNLSPKYYKKVLEFISSSEFFKQKVREYEQTIVKWQINFIKNGGEGWLCDEKLGGDICLLTPYCDIAFRKGVVDTLTAIGIDKQAIEEGLEKNANIWRNLYIEKAFCTKYEPIIFNFLGREDIEQFPKADLEHKQAWIKMRKYEYYCEHKKSVDLYGVVEPDMLLTQEEVISLKSYLDIQNSKRLEQIDQHKNQSGIAKKLTSNK